MLANPVLDSSGILKLAISSEHELGKLDVSGLQDIIPSIFVQYKYAGRPQNQRRGNVRPWLPWVADYYYRVITT